jgi:flagellar L-ring protein FlgH
MKRRLLILFVCGLAVPAGFAKSAKKTKPVEPTSLDRYIAEANARAAAEHASSPGSLFTPYSPFIELGRDLRASHVDDVITIVVNEQASAVVSGTTKTGRQSTAASSITGALGKIGAAKPLANLANTSTNVQLNGQGTTSRQTTLTTTLTARVTRVLPNGVLVIEGTKELQVNSERQMITLRGAVRVDDINPGNIVQSERIAQLELLVNGKGVVADAVRRPFILYRILLGILPF